MPAKFVCGGPVRPQDGLDRPSAPLYTLAGGSVRGSACVARRSARLGETGGVRRRGAAPGLLSVAPAALSA
jgi:hypothetical protein